VEIAKQMVLRKVRKDGESAIGCTTFATFFYSLRSDLSKYGSYSLHIHMFRYIHKHYLFSIILFIFVSKYSHKLTYIYSIWCKTNIFFILANICCKYSFWNEYSQNFKEMSHSREYSLAKFLHTSKYWLAYIRILAHFCFVLLQTIGSFWKYSLYFASKYVLWSEISKIFA
jgi:hypothetical protein